MSLLEEISTFSHTKLKKVETQITTPDGRILLENRNNGKFSQSPAPGCAGLGFVGDVKPDLQVVEIRPGLLLSSQDVTADLGLLERHRVTHILNVATGVKNVFTGKFVYKTVEILDLPETDITGYFDECFAFIDAARAKPGSNVLVHCNAGVSRAPSIVIAYVMFREGASFKRVFQELKGLRPAVRPNDGFRRSLENYQKILESKGTNGMR